MEIVYPAGSVGAQAARPQALRRAVRWLVPDLSLILSLAALFYCLFLFDGTQNLFRDSDAGWHIRSGEAILASAALPGSDPYSFSRPGEPWVAWEWGADLLMGVVYRLDGLRGVALLYAAAITAGVWLWVRLHWELGGNFLIVCALAMPMLSTTNIHWLARPHVLSWLFLLAAVLYLERAKRFTWRQAASIAVATAAWASLHGSFIFAPFLALVYAAGEWLRAHVWGLEPDRLRCYLLAAASALAGSFLNPYGWNLHLHVVRYLSDRELLARVGEFQSFNFHAEGAFQILLAVAAAMLGGVLALGHRRPEHFLIAAVLVALALRSARALPLVALVCLPYANASISQALRRARGLRDPLRRRLDAFLAYSDRLRALDARFSGAALAPLALLVALAWLGSPAVAARTGFPPDQFPVAAAAKIEKLPTTARILAPDKFGGYLIYRFEGRRKVFFDGRSDFYGADFLKQYARLVQVRPGWRDQIDAWGFTHALLPNDYSLVDALEHAGWKRLYRDGTATLLECPLQP